MKVRKRGIVIPDLHYPLEDKAAVNCVVKAVEMIKLENGEVAGLWKSYLPGLVNWVLQMDTKNMREYLLDTYEKVGHLKSVRNSILLTSNNFNAIKNSFINLMTTSPGEKILSPTFGISFEVKSAVIVIESPVESPICISPPRVKSPRMLELPNTFSSPNDPVEEVSPIKLPEMVNEPVSLGFNCLLSSKAIFFLFL